MGARPVSRVESQRAQRLRPLALDQLDRLVGVGRAGRLVVVVTDAGSPVRLDGARLVETLRPPTAGGSSAPVLRGWLGTPLTALDGRELGSIHLFNKTGGQFTALDEAIAVHVAQMSAAAVERTELYGRDRG